jgi:ABC-type phosphate/phosphonate transport system substrate-binding protein
VTQTKNTPSPCVILKPKKIDMAKGQQRSNREAKKPKKKKIKVIAAAPSQKSAGVVMSDKLPPAAV